MGDAGEPSRGTTRAWFAWLNAYRQTLFNYHDLNRRSMDMWERFAQRLRAPVDIVRSGELRWSVTPAAAEQLVARANALQSWGYPTRIIDTADVRALEPGLQTDRLTAAS